MADADKGGTFDHPKDAKVIRQETEDREQWIKDHEYTGGGQMTPEEYDKIGKGKNYKPHLNGPHSGETKGRESKTATAVRSIGEGNPAADKTASPGGSSNR